VYPKGSALIDEEGGLDELHHGLVGVPLVTHESDSNIDSDTTIDSHDDFMQLMDVEDQSMELTS
jgi:hypothetical protein